MAYYTSRSDKVCEEADSPVCWPSTTRSDVQQAPRYTMLPPTDVGQPQSLTSKTNEVTRDISYNYDYDPDQDENAYSDSGDSIHRGDELENGNIVPPLDIRSELNFPYEGEKTFHCRKNFKTAKLNLKPDKAYEDWLLKKRQVKGSEAARRKREEEARRQEQEERKRLAEQKYQAWLENKTKNSSVSQASTSRSATAVRTPTAPSMPSAQAPQASSQSCPKVQPPQEKQRKIEEWARAKRQQEEKRRKSQKRKEEESAKLEEERRRRCAGAWERWVQTSKDRPKPVPLNQGFFSLRGTVSDIYVNPNEWQSN